MNCYDAETTTAYANAEAAEGRDDIACSGCSKLFDPSELEDDLCATCQEDDLWLDQMPDSPVSARRFLDRVTIHILRGTVFESPADRMALAIVRQCRYQTLFKGGA